MADIPNLPLGEARETLADFDPRAVNNLGATSLGEMADVHGDGSDAPNPSRGTEISPRILGSDEAPCDKHGGCPHRSDCATYKLACQSFFQWAVGHELTKRDRATYPLQVPCRHSYHRVFNDDPDTLPPVPHHYQEQEPITRKAMLRAIAESK